MRPTLPACWGDLHPPLTPSKKSLCGPAPLPEIPPVWPPLCRGCLTQDWGKGLHWARRAIRASRVRGGRRSGANAGPRRWLRSRPSRHIQMESTELQSREAKAAAFQRCILGLRARDGQPQGLPLSGNKRARGTGPGTGDTVGHLILNHSCLMVNNDRHDSSRNHRTWL